MKVHWIDLGQVDYDVAQAYQLACLATQRERASSHHVMILAEPSAVITLGREASFADILASPETLAAQGIVMRHVKRGGRVTYHGPGQLLIYPIIDLKQWGRDVRRYVQHLETMVLRFLGYYGLSGECKTDVPGVWVHAEKMASIGIGVSRWVTYHGIGLNIETNLDHFNMIVPCGDREEHMTSLSHILGRNISVKESRDKVLCAFTEVFDATLSPLV